MSSERVRTIAIVGAGWSGLQIGKVLRDCGFDVSIIEELDDVGGTWHPARAYHGLAIHTPIYRCQFHEFDRAGANALHRVPSRDLFETSRSFAQASGLYEVTTFRQRVTHLAYSSRERTCRLTLQSLEDGSLSQRDYDFVVSTQFNAPRMPQLRGRSTFAGDVLHSNDVKTAVIDEIVDKRRKVVLLGGSKAASDLALALVERGYGFSWLTRAMYWFLNYDKAYFDHEKAKPAALVNRLIYVLGIRLITWRATSRLGFLLWRLTGMMHSPGRPHFDLRRFHHGCLDERQVATLRAHTEPVYGEIADLTAQHVRLSDGRRLACDVLICATGCDPLAVPIALDVDGVPLAYERAGPLYRHSVMPALPRLCFTGFFNFGFGPLNGYHRAAWIMKYLERDLSSAELGEIAAREASPDVPAFQNALFDSSGHFVPRTARQLDLMVDSPTPLRDYTEYLFNYAVRFRLEPLRSLDDYIRSRRRRSGT
jgi:cation diffusion facilitator CzcD-associated flavoprotein CzcO